MYNKKILDTLVDAGADIIKILNYFGVEASYDQIGRNIICPFHRDGTPSMQLNEDNTVHCYACDFHFDVVQLYTSFKTQDIDSGITAWDSEELVNTINSMIEDFGLEVNIDIQSGDICDEKDAYLKQLKENGYETIGDSLYLRNHPMNDWPYSAVTLPAKALYVYKNPETKEPLMMKVRYEAYLERSYDNIIYTRKGKEFIEYAKITPNSKIKRKTFRFYNIVDGKVVKGELPKDKKNNIYNGEKVFDIVCDDFKRACTWIWFVEGEKDVNTLREYGFTACSLMTGSGSEWDPKYNNLFRECKVIIATDFDAPGEKYEATLFQSLLYGKYNDNVNGENVEKYCTIGLKKMNKMFYEINSMPEKSDITDLIEKLKEEGLSKSDIKSKLYEIIERSIDYKATKSVVESDKGLYVGKKKIGDFTIVDAINIISTDNTQSDMIEITIRGVGVTCKKTHTRIACIHEIFGSSDAFNRCFSVMDSTFLGTKEELFKLKRFILTYKIFRSRTMYSSNGMYFHDGEWIMATPDGALRKDGTWDKDIFSSNTVMYTDLVDVDIPSIDKANDVTHALLNFNTPEIVYNILGEVGCKLLNAQYKKLGIKNHLLAINGTKGAGKTETSVKIFAALTNNNTRGEYNLSGQSNFTFLKNISSNNIGGMILQELKLGKMSDYDRNKWSEIFRNNFDRAKSQRGTKDQELNQYEQNNPIITTGEEGIGEESALYERFNLIFMTSDKRLSNPEYGENFRILCDNQATLRGIGKQMLIDIMNLTDDEIKSARKSIELEIRNKGLDKCGFVDRVLNNVINVIHGFSILSNTLVKLGYTGNINTAEAFDAIINNFLENVLRVNDGKANNDFEQMLLQYQRALENDYSDKVVGIAAKAYYIYDEYLWISPSKIRTIVAHFAQDCKLDIAMLSENEFRKNLVKAGYISEDESQKKRFNNSEAKGWHYRVDITRIKKLELGFIDELVRKNQILDSDKFLNHREDTDVNESKTEIELF